MASVRDGCPRQILRSWKEIAAHLKVDVRTAQRWKARTDIPIHHHDTGSRGHPTAYPDELDAWLTQHPADERDGRRQAEPDPAARLEGRPGPAAVERAGRLPASARFMIQLAVALLAFLGVVILVLAWQRRPPEIERVEVANGWLLAYGAHDELLWDRQLPGSGETAPPEAMGSDRLLLADITGNDRRDVLVHMRPRRGVPGTGLLAAFGEDGRLLWTHPYAATRRWNDREFDARFEGRLIRVVNAKGTRYVLATAAHALWFPAEAVLLDAASGRVVGEYWHPGSLIFAAIVDLDGDGDDEAVLSGINNPADDLGHGAVVALDIPFSTASPGPHPLSAYTGTHELAYALLPRPDACTATGSLAFAREVGVEDGRIFVHTACGDGILFTYLDYALRPAGIRLGNNYAPFHAHLEREGHLDHTLTAAEISCLGRVATFPGAVDGSLAVLQTRWRGCQ